MSPPVCENCHQRPQFGTHKYCGKTCAAQAKMIPPMTRRAPGSHKAAKVSKSSKRSTAWRAPKASKGLGATTRTKKATSTRSSIAVDANKLPKLCKGCGEKPKYGDFDYCGRVCAAKFSTSKGTTWQSPTQSKTKPATSQVHFKGPAAHEVDDDVSESEFLDSDSGDSDLSTNDSEVTSDLDEYPSEPDDSPSSPDEYPMVPHAKAARPATKQTAGTARNRAVCIIPKCGKPAYIDKSGVPNDYCSMRHREEAVTLGLANACIMCHRFPQGQTDYFCSTSCMTQAIAKT